MFLFVVIYNVKGETHKHLELMHNSHQNCVTVLCILLVMKRGNQDCFAGTRIDKTFFSLNLETKILLGFFLCVFNENVY